jgi:hypothetical protein
MTWQQVRCWKKKQQRRSGDGQLAMKLGLRLRRHGDGAPGKANGAWGNEVQRRITRRTAAGRFLARREPAGGSPVRTGQMGVCVVNFALEAVLRLTIAYFPRAHDASGQRGDRN